MNFQVFKWFGGLLAKVPEEVVGLEKFVEREIMSTTVAATAAHLNTINEALTAVTSIAGSSPTPPTAATILQGAVMVASAMNPEVAMLATPLEGLIQLIMSLRAMFGHPSAAAAPVVVPAVVPAELEPAAPVFGGSA